MIRETNINDYENIKKLIFQIQEIHLNKRPDIFNDKDSFSYNDYEMSLTAKNSFNYVYEENNIIKGYIMARIKEVGLIPVMNKRTILFIEDIVVDKNYYNEGIGTKLFTFIEEKARLLNIDSIELNVWNLNENALKFYEKMGFKVQRMQMEKRI